MMLVTQTVTPKSCILTWIQLPENTGKTSVEVSRESPDLSNIEVLLVFFLGEWNLLNSRLSAVFVTTNVDADRSSLLSHIVTAMQHLVGLHEEYEEYWRTFTICNKVMSVYRACIRILDIFYYFYSKNQIY
jgi:hypothetical protein